MHETDLAIIGGGPAGLTAGIYSSRMGIKTTIFEAEEIGGVARTAKKVENYPGFISISGSDLVEKMREHTLKCGANIQMHTVINIDAQNMVIKTNKDEWKTKAVIIATGAKRKKIGLPNENDLLEKGLSYCATCDGALYTNKPVAIVGGGNTAIMDAIYLAGLARKVHLICEEKELKGNQEFIDHLMTYNEVITHFNTKVDEVILKHDSISKLKLLNIHINEVQEIRAKALFIALGEDPFKLAKLINLHTDKSGSILVDQDQQTKIPGIYACGDVTGGIKQIGTAVGEGIIAAMRASVYVRKKKKEEE